MDLEKTPPGKELVPLTEYCHEFTILVIIYGNSPLLEKIVVFMLYFMIM